MTEDHTRSKRKPTGGRLTRHRKKKKHELGSENTNTEIGEPKAKKIRTRGGSNKIRALKTNQANVNDSENGETKKAEIKNVVENKANPHYVRRNIITKGAIIETSEGRARVTNRPGQESIVNAELIQD